MTEHWGFRHRVTHDELLCHKVSRYGASHHEVCHVMSCLVMGHHIARCLETRCPVRGCCVTGRQVTGRHVICCQVTRCYITMCQSLKVLRQKYNVRRCHVTGCQMMIRCQSVSLPGSYCGEAANKVRKVLRARAYEAV